MRRNLRRIKTQSKRQKGRERTRPFLCYLLAPEAAMETLKRPFLAIAATIAWAALAIQLYLSFHGASPNGLAASGAVLHFFSSFTILANIFAAVIWVLALRDENRPADTVTAVCIYLVVVIATYLAEFHGALETRRGGLAVFCDAVLHDAVPLLFLLYWFAFVPKGSLGWRSPFVWLIFPLAYLAYALLRGGLTGDYAYPWIDAAALGYVTVARNSLGLLGVFLGLGYVFLLFDWLLGRFCAPVDVAGSRA
jgi:hypothetical protein